MRKESFAGLKVRLTGGTDREGGGDGPLVVLLHGFGAPGDDLVPIWRQLSVPPETRFAFPEAPLELGYDIGYRDSRAWWMIDIARLERALARGELRDLSNEVPSGLSDARDAVDQMLSSLVAELGPPDVRLVLGGFSQGAMLATDLALRTDRRLSGLVVLSGTLLARTEWTSLLPARSGLPVLQSHGRDDPLLPFALAEELRALMSEAGLVVEWLPFNGGHGISPSVLDALGAFISRVTR